MKLPSRNRNWLKEIQTAYAKAERDLERDQAELKNIYVYAVKYAAKNRGIRDKATISAMLKQAIDAVKIEIRIDPESEKHHVFHFASTYIYSHCYADLINTRACDEIMNYVNQEWHLFSDEA